MAFPREISPIRETRPFSYVDAADQKAERWSRKTERARERKRERETAGGLSENNPWKRRGRGACEEEVA